VDWLVEAKERGDFVICGHNVNFDLNFLEAKLNDFKISDIKGLVGYRVLDTAAISLFLTLLGLIPAETGGSAEKVAKALGVTPGKHTSETDVEATKNTLIAMMQKVQMGYISSEVVIGK